MGAFTPAAWRKSLEDSENNEEEEQRKKQTQNN